MKISKFLLDIFARAHAQKDATHSFEGKKKKKKKKKFNTKKI